VQTKYRADLILSRQTAFKKLVLLNHHPYLIRRETSQDYAVTYVPGFSSAIDFTDLQETLMAVDELKRHSGTLMVFCCKSSHTIDDAREIISCYPSINLLNWSFGKTAFIDCNQGDLHTLLSKVKRGNRARIKSFDGAFKIVKEYDEDFFEIYKNLAERKSFKSIYSFPKDIFLELSKEPNVLFRGI
jgi:hypothetical protein